MKQVVVGVEESAAAERALDRALFEAGRAGAAVRALHAWTAPVWIAGDPAFGWTDPGAQVGVRERAVSIAEDLVAKGESRRVVSEAVPVTPVVSEGDPGRVLTAASHGADLLVVGGRGYGALTGALLGSATSYVLHHASCPVMVVPEQGPPVGPFRRVVVGVDGSPGSREALRWGQAEAVRHGCPLVPLYVESHTPMAGPFFTLPVIPDVAAALTWLAGEVQEVLAAPVGIEVLPQVGIGPVARTLMENTGPEDVLVLGTRGHGGFARLLLGSVATQCAQHSESVVVTVRGPATT